jgi:FLVCR family feline leukemia virus subgroup C receptor-related protein
MLVPNLLLTRSKPPTPPCEQPPQPAQSFLALIGNMLGDANYRLLFGAYLLYFGAFNAIANNMSFLLQPYFGKNTLVTTLAGSTPIISGVLGVIIFTALQRRENRMRKYIMVCMVGTFCCVAVFVFVLMTKSVALVCFMSMANSFFLIPLIPIMLELGCELAYPVGEGAAVGFMIAGGNLGGFLIGFLMSLYVRGENERQTVAGLATVLCVFIIGFGLIFLVKEVKKRQRAEIDSFNERKDRGSMLGNAEDVYGRPTGING